MKREIENKSQLGEFIEATPHENDRRKRSVLNYHSGLSDLDEFAKDKDLIALEVDFQIALYENGILLMLVQGKDPVWILPIKRRSIINIDKIIDQEIMLRRGRVDGGVLSGIAATGFPGAILATAIDVLSSSSGSSKERSFKGTIFKITVQQESSEPEIVIVSTLEKYTEIVEAFFEKIKNYKKQEEKWCFIATVCYGDIDAPQVNTFRKYRDVKLRKSYFGRFFIRIYYIVSPKLSKWLSKKQKIKYAIIKLVLDPIYNKIKHL